MVKSIGLLQAYGEFDRFMYMSKDYLKQKRIIMKRNRQALQDAENKDDLETK